MRWAMLVLAAALAFTAPATAKTVKFSGACGFAGAIKPSPPITIAPHSGARFSYHGSGTCKGSITGPIRVTFTNVSTLFDTCELGPDFNLNGVATIGAGRRRATFHITINLARLAVTGPFSLTTIGGGYAYGTAQFEPQNASTAPAQCVSGGIRSASLAANFQTVAPLVGSADPPRPARRKPVRCRRRCSHRKR